MVSKYDSYWMQRLDKIEGLLKEAMKLGRSQRIDVNDLSKLGNRDSWYGTLYVSSNSTPNALMAHMNSLGNILIESNVLSNFENTTFRFTVTRDLKLHVDVSQPSSALKRKRTYSDSPPDQAIYEIPIMRGQMNKAENAIEKMFQELTGNIIAELAFIDKTTFGYLDSIPKHCGIRIITANIKNPEKCKIKAEKCSRERPYFEIVEIRKIHKRYIGSENSFFVDVGADLKADALGRSIHTIKRLNPNSFHNEAEHFEKLWNMSEQELKKTYDSSLTKTRFFSSKDARCHR